MKSKNLIKILTGSVLLFSLPSCSSFLEVTPADQVSDATLWVNKDNADLFLNNVYSSITSPFGTFDPGENWSDNSINGVNGQRSHTIYAISAYNAENVEGTEHRWGLYAAIRKANLFIERVSEGSLDENWKKVRLAEARFLRAYFYNILWTSHGSVPIVTKVLNQNTQGEAIFQANNTAEEVFKFITEECEAAAQDLPKSADLGRATQGAALTLKGWAQLFWASPLYNTSNDLKRWEAAAETNKRVIDLKVYSLFADYNEQFFEANNNNKESIFQRRHLGGTVLGSSREGLQGPTFVRSAAKSYGGVNPTQEMVDAYFMKNGLPITDPNSGYDPQKPYANREKRFYQSIVYDGAEWKGDIMVMKQGVGSKNATDVSNVNEATNTGYYLRKGMNPQYDVLGPNRLSSASYTIFRYAEVLLSYAEALNEAKGAVPEVYDVIKLLRDRSDLPNFPAGLNQSDMRKLIQQERRVELAFEEKRWLDIIRLKQAEIVLNQNSHGILIEDIAGTTVYKVFEAPNGKRVFDKTKNYFLPIPQDALDRNKKLTPTPNY
ncbi:RagB/SusD family nutrient uptake outer membrane protein [Sphingobacterium tabacisoli]|uniref:RagB/SusD family nutrient uptake outer membrane protein n=1 Tax=Sphingobacterium tabacisoli TaxID=2044855 RepID=A0ABW5KZ06_9SPHI|nr:RagB/SusD family nutrient uptake outer membrane protein [Sphingobacterium tabacisoli]